MRERDGDVIATHGQMPLQVVREPSERAGLPLLMPRCETAASFISIEKWLKFHHFGSKFVKT